jgi:Flp pilus assembly protein TadG
MPGYFLKDFRKRMRARSRSGSAAVEFAFVAPVFFLFLFGILEGGIMFFGKSVLQNSVQNAARLIRTGQAQGVLDQAAFRQRVCNGISELLNCDNLQVDVRVLPAGFPTGGLGSPTDANGNLNAGLNSYNIGDACDVVVVRGFYRYTVMTPLIAPLIAGNTGNNFRVLSAAAAFRNEPFNANVSGC